MSTLSSKEARSLIKEKQKLLKELGQLSFLIHGSFFERYSTCSRPGCACHKGERHGPRAYVAGRPGGKPRQHYIRKSQVGVVQEGIEQYRRMLQIADRISEINLELARAGKLDASSQELSRERM
jgi:hypothetical protein